MALPLQIPEVKPELTHRHRETLLIRGRVGLRIVQLVLGFVQVCRCQHGEPVNLGRLIPIGLWHQQVPGPRGLGRLSHGQHPTHRSQAAIQTQLPCGPEALQPGQGNAPSGGLEGKGHGQVKAGTLLAQGSRSQIDRETRHQRALAAVAQGRANPLARLLNRGIRQAHNLKRRQARA